VELKADRAAFERRVGTLIGAQEKIGLVPGLIALVAAIARFYSPDAQGALSSPLIQGFVYGIPVLYLAGIWLHTLMSQMDRVIMLFEMIIEAKKEEEDKPSEGIESIC
jgi:hypothetical protein